MQELARLTMLTTEFFEHERRNVGKASQKVLYKSSASGDGLTKDRLKNTVFEGADNWSLKYLMTSCLDLQRN